MTGVVRRYSAQSQKRMLPGLWAVVRGLWESRFVAWNLLVDHLNRRYDGSALGILWAVLSPLLTMLAIALVLPLLMRVKMENYVVYLFSGLLVWRFITSAIQTGAGALVSQKALIMKVALPSILFPAVVSAAEFINFLLVLFALLIAGFGFGFALHFHVLFFLAASCITLIFCFGLAAILSMTIVYFRDIKYILDVIVYAFFYITPVIYPLSIIPEKYQYVMNFNIFYHFVKLFHDAIYYAAPPQWAALLLPLMLAIGTLALGFMLHWKVGRFFVYRI